VYDDGALQTDITGETAEVRLADSVQLDSRGSWLGDPTGGQGVSFGLHLVRQGGEWRISDPPDALVVSRTHFDTRFVRYDLSFFDPSGRVLVPEPVYVPAGDQAPSVLVSGLLAGPDAALQPVERTFFPNGTRLALDVRVEDGVAEVPLSQEILDTDSGQLELAMAQLAWTLRQIPGLSKMRVTVDGTPVDSRTGASARSLDGWASYDASVPSASTDLFAFRNGSVVSEADSEETLVSDAFKSRPMRSLGVSMGSAPDAVHLEAVTQDGRRVFDAVVDTEELATQVYVGNDVLRPDFDLFDHTWLLDRTRSGARIVVLLGGRRVLRLTADGITGHDVTAFELSRDGTRLAAVADGKVVMARVSRSENGRPTRILPAAPIPIEGQPAATPVDVAWTNPSTLGVLTKIAPTISQVLLASVDGSFAPTTTATSLEPLFERAENLVTRPGVDVPVYLVARTGLYSVSPTGHWGLSSLAAGLIAPTFAG
jgi:hypothetical protein